MKLNIESLIKQINMKELNLSEERYQYDGVSLPRTTEILSAMLHEDSITVWANNIGLYQKKKYKEELQIAANKGTYVHNAIEDFIQNNNELDMNTVLAGYQVEVSYAYGSFKSWWDIISKRNVKIIMQEQKLVCPWFGGTLDLLIEIDGRVYLLDFKTSNYTSYKYFLQLAAYRYILRNYFGIEIYGCGVIKLNKTEIKFEEFIIDKSMYDYEDFMTLCENTFLSLVYAYYHRMQVENFYNNIF